MWPADVATRPHHEAGENDGLLNAYESGAAGDEKAAEERWHHDEKAKVKDVFVAGVNESSTAHRREYPSYLRFETQGPSSSSDWRDVTIVSLFSTYTMSTRFPFAFFTQALCQLTTPLCLPSILIQSFIHLLFKSLLITFASFLPHIYILLAKQPAYSATATQAFQQNNFSSTTATSSLAGQLTTSFSASSRISSTFSNSKTQHTNSHHGCF
jgi:hypothetical protein